MRGILETPAGLTYVADLIDAETEEMLLGFLGTLELEPVSIRGNVAKRTVRHFGRRYDYGSHVLRQAEPIPPELDQLRHRVAEVAGLEDTDLVEALVNRYPAGAGIGWHTDAPVYKTIVGISLGASCEMQFRSGPASGRRVFELLLEPRSAYLMRGAASTEWQHRITPTEDERISVTFRSL
jgi:DNA oxidative demethylase